MRIYVDKFYQNTKGDKVQAGEHNASDLPNGLAQYLVDNGHAVVINSELVTDTKMVIENDDGSVEVDTFNADDRQDLLAEYETLTGKKPSKNIKTSTLRQRIADLRSDD